MPTFLLGNNIASFLIGLEDLTINTKWKITEEIAIKYAIHPMSWKELCQA